MQNITQPFINLSTANAALITRFAQSPEMVDLARNSAQKYFELAQKSFGHVAASGAYTDLVQQLTENYSTFAREYAESLMGIAAEGRSLIEQQVQEASHRFAQSGQAAVKAVANSSDKVRKSRAR
jgi:hypothetical protein